MAIAETGAALLERVGLAHDDVARWSSLEPTFGADAWTADARAASSFLLSGQALIERLPPRRDRSPAEEEAADAIISGLRATRIGFLRRHAGALYDAMTDARRRFVRI